MTTERSNGGARRPLESQVVVITGASSGIGRSTARHVARRGAAVVLTARRADALGALAQEIREAGGQALAVAADVTREDELEAVADAAMSRFGRIDTWVNGAAVFIQGSVEDTTLEEYRRLLDVNLLGVIAGTRIALSRMRARDRGTIIQISSIVAERAAPLFSAYTASKAAVDHFTDALRVELYGSGIQVCTLHVQQTDTPIYRHARSKLGTIPKPPPFVMDPATVARQIGRLAERPKPKRTLGAFGRVYAKLIGRLPTAVSDWIVYRGSGFTRTAAPSHDDNLYAPMHDEPRERDGWSRRGWRGVTLRETARVLPVELLLGAAAVGFGAARVERWLRARDPHPHNGRARANGHAAAPAGSNGATRAAAHAGGNGGAPVETVVGGGGAPVGDALPHPPAARQVDGTTARPSSRLPANRS